MPWNAPSISDAGMIPFLAVTLSLIAGCAGPPSRFIDAVPWTARQQGVSEARAQEVAGFPCLRVNAELIDELDHVLATKDLEPAREGALRFLDHARGLSLEVSGLELERLDDRAWQGLASEHFAYEHPMDPSLRLLLTEEYLHRTGLQYELLRRQITAAASMEEITAVLTPLRGAIQPSIKTRGRFARAAPLALFTLPSGIAAAALGSQTHLIDDPPFDQAVRYTPAATAASAEQDLLLAYAPTLIQQIHPDAAYKPEIDRIGRVTLDDRGRIAIDTAHPTVYAYTREVHLAGTMRTQLTYTWWFPKHPPLKKPIDAEAGPIEGVTLRVTLDRENQPALYETVFNCGCYHTIYPTASLARLAQEHHGPPLKGKRFSIEQSVPGHTDVIIGGLLEGQAHDGAVLRSRAADHRVSTVRLSDEGNGRGELSVPYELRPYADLERLRTPGGRVVSMFQDNGLVRGAARLEGLLFTPIGILSAGQPRQRGTQLIHFDQFDFDHPHTLEVLLRLPPEF